MSQSAQDILWQIIKVNMGDKSLNLFIDFHRAETIRDQYKGALEIFEDLFGEEKATEMLHPVSDKFIKEGN